MRAAVEKTAATIVLIGIVVVAEAGTYLFSARQAEAPRPTPISSPTPSPAPTPTPIPTAVPIPVPGASLLLISMQSNHCSALGRQIIAELGEIKRCTSNSDCVRGFVPNLPCTISICKIPYSKNEDLGKIRSLTLQYRNSGCEQGCPTHACFEDIGVPVSVRCENNRCVEKFSR